MEHCGRARHWGYEYEGKGLKPQSLAIPLATGISVHAAIEGMLRHVVEEGGPPTRLEARALIGAVAQAYRAEAGAAGFHGQEAQSPETVQLIAEQGALIEGLSWAFWRSVLPYLVSEFQIVAVEEEIDYVLGCDCGLGDGTVGKVLVNPVDVTLTHEGRVCSGVAVMIRPDFITRRHSDGAVGVWDLKTTAGESKPREMEFMVQLALGVTGAGAVTGEQCTHHYLVGLHKGQRKADEWGKAAEGKQQVKRQRSPFCYLYYKPADPPYGEAEYSAEYTSRKGWGRVPVWELTFPGQDDTEPGAGPVEHWVLDKMKAEQVAERVSLNGPTQAPIHLIPGILEEVEAEARHWAQVEDAVREDPGGLNTYVRRSWDCYPYGEPCIFLRVCAGDPGMDKPEQTGRFEWREPHHVLEGRLREVEHD